MRPHGQSDGDRGSAIHRWAKERTLGYAIASDLEVARSGIEEAIGVSVRGDVIADAEGNVASGHRAPAPERELHTLRRIMTQLQDMLTRFREVSAHDEIHDTADDVEIDQAASRHELDVQLAERVRRIACRLDHRFACQADLAELESDLSEAERILDERTIGARLSRCLTTNSERYQDLPLTFRRHLDRFKQLDVCLIQIDQFIAEAGMDFLLREFWRGVKRDYRLEAHHLARQIGEEAIHLALSNLRS